MVHEHGVNPHSRMTVRIYPSHAVAAYGNRHVSKILPVKGRRLRPDIIAVLSAIYREGKPWPQAEKSKCNQVSHFTSQFHIPSPNHCRLQNSQRIARATTRY